MPKKTTAAILAYMILASHAVAQSSSDWAAPPKPMPKPVPEQAIGGEDLLAPGDAAGVTVAQSSSGTPSWVLPAAGLVAAGAVACIIVCGGGKSAPSTSAVATH